MKQLIVTTQKHKKAFPLFCSIPTIPIPSLSARLGRLRSIRLGLIGLGLISLSSVLSAATVDDLTFTLINEGTEYAVTDCADSATGTLTIPATYEGKPVTEIGASAFLQSKLTAVELPAGLRGIKPYAFSNSSIESIDLPAGLTDLGDTVFAYCYSLTGSVTIPSGITEIPASLFYKTALTDVILHDGVTSIGLYAFYFTDISSINLPSSLRTIGDYAFANTDLQSITLPAGLTALGVSAFSGCESLTGSVTIPSAITELPDYLFYDTALTDVIFNDALTSIGARAFASTNISFINLPSSMKSIGDYAFASTDLESFNLRGSYTYLGVGAFQDCASLTGWVSIPAEITEIPDYLFYNCPLLTGVYLYDDGATSIGEYAFYNTGISSINLPNSLRTIGDYAFAYTDLESLRLPAGLTALGSSAFAHCYSLTGFLRIPSGITEIPNSLFDSCTALTDVMLHDALTSIGAWAFASTNIYAINLPSSLKTIGDYAFATTDLQSITLPAALTALGYRAFVSTYYLAEVRLEGAAPSLGTDVFTDAGKEVAGETNFFIYDTYQSSYDNSADWSGFSFTVLGDPNPPMMEAFVLSTSLDASGNRFTIHSHGEPSAASASVLVQHRSSLTEGEWTAVASADVTESRDSESGVVTRSLSLSPSTEEDGAFYRLHYTGSQSSQ